MHKRAEADDFLKTSKEVTMCVWSYDSTYTIRFRCPGFKYRAVLCIYADISKNLVTSVFMIEHAGFQPDAECSSETSV